MAYDSISPNYQDSEVKFDVFVEGATKTELNEVSFVELYLGESLLTPGLQTSVKVHSYLHSLPNKNFDLFKNKNIHIVLEKPILSQYGFKSTMSINQLIYRLDNRKRINNQNEEMIFRACDRSLINDAETLVSKSWKCSTPSDIVDYVLRSCAGVPSDRLSIQESDFPRDYIAENIHPFQVVNQQSSYAVSTEKHDPSFLHYMTYENFGTHHFKSLDHLTKPDNGVAGTFIYNDTGSAYPFPNSILSYEFPCDFDLLSDALNGVNSSGKDMSALTLIDPLKKTFSMLSGGDNTPIGCGLGEGVFRYAISNHMSAKNMDACPDYAKVYLLKRQARMNLLEKDKIALRVTIPFNASMNVGKMIDIKLYNKEALPEQVELYGSGRYLILSLFHHIVSGGYSLTTMDCVSNTVGNGEV